MSDVGNEIGTSAGFPGSKPKVRPPALLSRRLVAFPLIRRGRRDYAPMVSWLLVARSSHIPVGILLRLREAVSGVCAPVRPCRPLVNGPSNDNNTVRKTEVCLSRHETVMTEFSLRAWRRISMEQGRYAKQQTSIMGLGLADLAFNGAHPA
jgi:hypothetical protein